MSKDTIYESRVSFSLYDFECDAEEITNLLDLKPDRIEVKGEEKIIGVGDNKIARLIESNAWVLESSSTIPDSIEDQLKALMAKLNSVQTVLKDLTEKYYAEISLVAYYPDSNLGLHIDKKLLNEISSLGVDLDLDFYCLGE